jgi:hypothetical protein
LSSGELQEPSREITDRDELRERLKARGLLTDAPAVVIPKLPRPEPAPAAPIIPGSVEDEESHWAESPFDAWDVEPTTFETSEVRCPSCRETCTVPVEATRVTCPSCTRSWRYVICMHCDHLDLVMERQESFTCHRCHGSSRSWWRTPMAPKLAPRIVTRRKDAYVQEQRRIVREGMRMRRWKLVVLAVVAGLAAGLIVGVTRAAEPDVDTGVAVACPHLRSILEDVAAARITPAELDAELDELQAEAQGGSPELATAAVSMRAAGGPTAPEFITARAAAVDACGADLGRG